MTTSRSTSAAISTTDSSLSDWVMVTISPRPIMILMICATVIPSAAERSLTLTPDGTVTGPVGARNGLLTRLGARRSAAIARLAAVAAALCCRRR